MGATPTGIAIRFGHCLQRTLRSTPYAGYRRMLCQGARRPEREDR